MRTNFLNTVSTLNVGNIVAALVGGIVCAPCASSKEIYTTVLPSANIDVNIESGSGSANVTGSSCTATGSKSLNVQPTTSLANVRVGSISNAFSSSAQVTVAPVSLVEIGYRETRYSSCLLSILGPLLCSNQTWKDPSGNFVSNKANALITVIAGLGAKLDLPVGASSPLTPFVYTAPAADNLPELNAPVYSGQGADPSYKQLTSQSLVASLSATLGGLTIQPYGSNGGGILGQALIGTISIISGLISTLQTTIDTALAPLLDPAINALLDALGIDLAKTEVGARMSCSNGVELVY